MIASARLSGDHQLVYSEPAASCDRQIHAAASAALAASKYIPLRQLNCRVADGVVEISGTVSSFYLKQLAQAAVLQLNWAGVVRNLVEVSGESIALAATDCRNSLD
ncbi:MAG: BON domain-containing protein [Planctomycetia bacterium]|nr:BON domain-containing protein [Planctomycetia bacterium]